RSLRKKIAEEKNVPPYVLFSDATLKDLCRYFPQTKEEILQIKGIGMKKYDQYGEVFIQTITEWRKDHPGVKRSVQISDAPPLRRKTKPRTNSDEPSHLSSYRMFQSGKSLKEIALMRDINEQTVESHLFKAYKEGQPIIWDIFFTEKEEAQVLDIHQQMEEPRLKPMKEALPEAYNYTKIKAVLVKNGHM